MADCATGILVDLNDEEKNEKLSNETEVTLPPLSFDVDVPPDPEPESVKPNIICVDDLLKEDVKLIDSEEFNFDLLTTPTTDEASDEDEEEVFFGPVQGFSEICAAASLKDKPTEELKPMSPLNPKQIAELFKEAHTLAFRIENSKTDSPDVISDLSRKLCETRITRKPVSPVKSEIIVNEPSGDDKVDKFYVDNKAPEKVAALGGKIAEMKMQLPKVDLPKTAGGAVKFQGKKERGLEGLKCSKITKTGQRVPTSGAPGKSGIQRPGSRLLRGGSMRSKRPVMSPLKRQRKNSAGSDGETASVCSDTSEGSLTGPPLPGKRQLAPPRRKELSDTRQTLQLPQPRTRTLSNSSAGSNCSSSSQVSNCSQSSSSRVPRTKLHLKPPTNNLKITAKPQEKSAGPVKAKARSPVKVAGLGSRLAKDGGKENQPSMKPPGSRPPRRSVASSTSSGGSLGATPQKPEKLVQPRRLLSSGAPSTPRQESVVSGPPRTPKSSVPQSAPGRRSLLPTPSSARAVKPSPLTSRSQEGGASPPLPRRSTLTRTTSLRTPDPSKKLLFPL